MPGRWLPGENRQFPGSPPGAGPPASTPYSPAAAPYSPGSTGASTTSTSTSGGANSGAASGWINSYTADPAEQKRLQALLTQIFGKNIPTYIDSSGSPQMAQWAQQFLTDELDAQKEGDWYGATLDGFKMPANVGTADWMAVLGLGEKWASLTGYKYMPTGTMLLNLYNNHITDQQQANDFFWGKLSTPLQQQYANARVGMSHTDYQSALSSYQDSLEKLTGNRDAQYGLDVAQAVHDHWSTQRFDQAIRTNYSANSQYAYLNPKYGTFDYNTWQQHKLDSRNEIQNRYGSTSDASYISALDNPLTAFQSTGGQIQGMTPGKNTLADYGVSAVR